LTPVQRYDALFGPGFELPKTESPHFRDFFAATRARWEAEGHPGLVTDPGLVTEQNAPQPVSLKHASLSETKPVLSGT
jgi:hypothetical protein